MSERDEEDRKRERPSWREIDQRKDRSRHVSDGPRPAQGKKGKAKDEWLRKMALKEANKHPGQARNSGARKCGQYLA